MQKKDEYKNPELQIKLINTWFKIVILSAIIAVILYRIIIGKFDFSGFDYSDFLSLVLAIFSIWLSVMFYIKAEETSNMFYDNTYKFTGHVSEILGRIETGFGERLRHIDEGYNKLENIYMSTYPLLGSKEETQKEKDNLKKMEEENRKIEALVKQSKLEAAEKDRIIERLTRSNRELAQSREELEIRIKEGETSSVSERLSVALRHLFSYVAEKYNLFDYIDNSRRFKSEFKKAMICEDEPAWESDLRISGIIDDNGDLTSRGFSLIRKEYSKFNSTSRL